MCCQGHRWESVRYKPVLKDLAVKDIRVQHFHAMHVQTMFGLLYLNMTFLKRQKKKKKQLVTHTTLTPSVLNVRLTLYHFETAKTEQES